MILIILHSTDRKNAQQGKFDHFLTRLNLLQKARILRTFLVRGATFKHKIFFG